MSSFLAIVQRARRFLESNGRVSLRALKREFDGSPQVEDANPLEENWWVIILGGMVLAALTAIIIFARINLRP